MTRRLEGPTSRTTSPTTSSAGRVNGSATDCAGTARCSGKTGRTFSFRFSERSYSGTIITNGGQARIKGVESELEWAASQGLTLGASFTFLDATLQQNYCGVAGVTDCPNLATRIPFAPGRRGDGDGPACHSRRALAGQPALQGQSARLAYRLAPFGGWRAPRAGSVYVSDRNSAAPAHGGSAGGRHAAATGCSISPPVSRKTGSTFSLP